MYLHHYFNSKNGPFLSISDLSSDEALKSFHKMVRFLTERNGEEYHPDDTRWEFVRNRHTLRRDLESEMRRRFIDKGGSAPREYPYYLILCPDDKRDKGLYAFYENPDYISIPVEDLDMNTVSFTYGDSFVQYYQTAEKPEIVYTYNEILEVIKKNGWVTKEEKSGWGFVEAHLWSDDQIAKYRKQHIE
jgi:hypothetical protein